MKTTQHLAAAAALSLISLPCAATPSLIPLPVSVSPGTGSFTLSRQTEICARGEARVTADQLRDLIFDLRGLKLKTGCGRNAIHLVQSENAPVAAPEGYSLDVGTDGATLQARSSAGLYYAAVTFSQLASSDGGWKAPAHIAATHITDYPHYRWRGMMLDTVRHFLPVAAIKTMIDQMAEHKLNMLHLHLTDDQGWRVEIKRYPELTKIGAWRTPPTNGGPGSETKPYGGFYSQKQIRDLVAYAAARHITIVPELDMPGHAQAAVAAHPELSVPGDQPKVSGDWGVNWYLYNPDKKNIRFVENVLDEVMQLFPGPYIHLGGDEAVKNQWKSSPEVQAQMKALGITSEDAMQSWFMQQVGEYLAAHGRRMMGWDEILQGGVPPSATVMSWRGTQGAVTAARLGHDVVLSPDPTLYLNHLQSGLDDEPAAAGYIVPLSQVYDFQVMPAALDAEAARHVLGAQANLWSEYLITPWYFQHAAYPRAAAFSEVVWSPPESRSWAGFLDRMPAEMQRYRHQHFAAADSAFAVDFQLPDGRNAALKAGSGQVILQNQTGYGDIHYTLDGSAPTKSSAQYHAPLQLKLGTQIRAASFSRDGILLGAARSYAFTADTLLTRNTNQLRACPGGDFGLRVPLTPDSPKTRPVYNLDIFHDCYVYPDADMTNVHAVKVSFARLSRNYALANDAGKVKQYPAKTKFGELVVYAGSPDGKELARIALPDPATAPAEMLRTIPLPSASGTDNLSFVFTAPVSGPIYAIGSVRLMPR